MTKAFKQGFMDMMQKIAAQEQPQIDDATGAATLGKIRNKARNGFEPFLGSLTRAYGQGPLIGNYDAWDQAEQAAQESVANNSGVPDYGPIMKTIGAIHGLNSDDELLNDLVSDANAAFVSPERWARMTGAGTGPTAH